MCFFKITFSESSWWNAYKGRISTITWTLCIFDLNRTVKRKNPSRHNL